MPQFDPALGTLTQVDLTWETLAAVEGQIDHDGTAGSGNLAGAHLQFDFNAPGVVIAQLNEPTFLFAWPDGPSPIVIAPSDSAKVANGQQVNPSFWGLYTGTGNVDVGWQYFGIGSGITWVGSPGSTMRVDKRLGGYSFLVTYKYDVPEPGTLALLGLGLAGLGLARRRKA